VILFIADGTGMPTLNAASIYEYDESLRLFVYQMPHLALSSPSAANNWVADSGAGMTAIVTGVHTNNGVLSQGPGAIRGKKDGTLLKTILEYAEERGLATGVVSNSPMADATPAACYAHSNDRSKTGEIFDQILSPRFGNGVDVVIGPGRTPILEATEKLGIDLVSELKAAGYTYLEAENELRDAASFESRVIALYDSDEEYDLGVSTSKALDVLERAPKGFFLMVESNNHSTDIKPTLEKMVRMDRIVRDTVERFKDTDTLILFTADHSYGIYVPTAPRDEPFIEHVAVNNTHTAEEVLVAGFGPGSERIRGAFPSTHLFSIMMEAYGWTAE
jgi:alkaline phosphatase